MVLVVEWDSAGGVEYVVQLHAYRQHMIAIYVDVLSDEQAADPSNCAWRNGYHVDPA